MRLVLRTMVDAFALTRHCCCCDVCGLCSVVAQRGRKTQFESDGEVTGQTESSGLVEQRTVVVVVVVHTAV